MSTLEGAADGALILDTEGQVVFWNSSAERLLGFSPSFVFRTCSRTGGAAGRSFPRRSPGDGIVWDQDPGEKDHNFP